MGFRRSIDSDIRQSLLVAKESTISLGLPVHAEAWIRYGLTSEVLRAHGLIAQMHSDLESEEVDWENTEQLLHELQKCGRFTLGHEVQLSTQLNFALSAIVRKLLAEAEARSGKGDLFGGQRLYMSLRELLMRGILADSLISMLIIISFWKRYLASLESIDPRLRGELSYEIIEDPILPNPTEVLLGEFAFQWRQIDTTNQELDRRATRRQIKFLDNWNLIYSELRDCPDFASVGTTYQALTSQIKPNLGLGFFKSKRPLDSVEWMSLDASVRQMLLGYEALRQSRA